MATSAITLDAAKWGQEPGSGFRSLFPSIRSAATANNPSLMLLRARCEDTINQGMRLQSHCLDDIAERQDRSIARALRAQHGDGRAISGDLQFLITLQIRLSF